MGTIQLGTAQSTPHSISLKDLLQLAAQKLQAEKIVRIGITRLEQMVATARQQAHKETFQRLEPLLTQERQVFLDSLLLYNPTIGSTA